MQWFGVRMKLAYVAPSLVTWGGIYAAGVHPTVAGVIVGLLTPVRAWLGPTGFLVSVRNQIDRLTKVSPSVFSSHELAEALRQVNVARREAMSPAESLIEALHPWVAFVIMPIFALANAGVRLSGGSLDPSSWSVVTGIVIGLVLGKPLGILLASWVSVKLRLGVLPAGITLRHLVVLGVVAGVGFTMALFIGQLAFTDEKLLGAAKIGVLVASGVAAVLGLVTGSLCLRPVKLPGVAQTADEAEVSTVK
jgi:NhaA family Na+:H+ antiporter